MKILIVSHEYPPIGGGGANACMFLSKEFSKEGNQVTILTARYKEQLFEEKLDENTNIIHVKCLRKKVQNSNFLEMATFLVSAWKKADKLQKKNKYDVCLVFFGIPSGPIALHLKRKYGLPYVIRTGGGDIPGAQKRFALLYKLLAPSIRKIWKEALGITANSQGLKDRALKFDDNYEITVIENGVDLSFFYPANKKDSNSINILFVSRILEGKGLQYVIPKLRDIQNEIKKINGNTIKLTIVGDGPYKENLEQLVEREGSGDLVTFEGHKSKNEVKEYYQNADIFLLPSLSEGMPNVVLEAMACKLPIIITPCEGSKELVTDNGFIVKHSDIKEKLVYLCANEEVRQEMGENSLKNVKEKYQWKIIGKRYLNFIQDRIKNNSEE